MRSVRRLSASRLNSGFTLIELLVVVAIISLLMSILLPALGKAKELARRSVCMANARTLSLAWQTYADDNKNRLVPTWTRSNFSSKGKGWVIEGNDKDSIEDGLLWRYVGNMDAYRCVSDFNGYMRSFSLNEHTGPGTIGDYPRVTKLDEIRRTSGTFAFAEEYDPRKDGYNRDGWMISIEKSDIWVDVPARWHDHGANWSFADGHSEYWKWQDPRTVAITDLHTSTPNNPDLRRVRAAAFWQPE